MMALQVDKTHLSRKHSAPDTSGNLYDSTTGHDALVVHGGWHGKHRQRRRKIIGASLLIGAAGAAVAAKKLAEQPIAKKSIKVAAKTA